jgi:hypothetical protein
MIELPPPPPPSHMAGDFDQAWSCVTIARWERKNQERYTKPLHSADQMRAYGEACARAAIEAAAGEVERAKPYRVASLEGVNAVRIEIMRLRMAEGIRALTAPLSPSSSQTRS